MVEINVYADNLSSHSYYQLGDLNLPVLETLKRLLPANGFGKEFFDKDEAHLDLPAPGVWSQEFSGIKILELEIRGYLKRDKQIKANQKAKKYKMNRDTLRYGAILQANPKAVDQFSNIVLSSGGNIVNSVLGEKLRFQWGPGYYSICNFYFPAGEDGYKVSNNLSAILQSGFKDYVKKEED